MNNLVIVPIIAGVIAVAFFSINGMDLETTTNEIESKVLGESDTQSEKNNDNAILNPVEPGPAINTDRIAMEIHQKTNEVRKEHGLSELKWNDNIAQVAKTYSQRMADLDFLDHYDVETNESSGDRGIKNGFEYCGNVDSIKLNYEIDKMENKFNNDMVSYNQKLDRYDYLVEYHSTFGNDNISVFNEMNQLKKELDEVRPQLQKDNDLIDLKINEINEIIIRGESFEGFGENIALRGGLAQDKIPDSTLQGWLNSPEHREVLLTPSWTQEGIGIAVDKDNSVIITANFC